MPFPVDLKYVLEAQSELKVIFPDDFKSRMIKLNGGALIINKYEFELYPFFDKSDRKRISRTCNHIGLETKNASEWNGFPENAVAIGSDGLGNQLVLMHNGNGILKKHIYFWNHEIGKVDKIAESINVLNVEKSKNNIEQPSLWHRMKSKFK